MIFGRNGGFCFCFDFGLSCSILGDDCRFFCGENSSSIGFLFDVFGKFKLGLFIVDFVVFFFVL